MAHLLQGGVLDGKKPGPLGIKVEDMTDDVWDAIFLGEWSAHVLLARVLHMHRVPAPGWWVS